MSHRPRYAQKHHRWWLWATAIIVIAAVWYRYNIFNPQKIIDESILKDRTFNTEIREITAPQSGIKAYLMTDNSNPIVGIEFIFADSGTSSEPRNLKGLASLTVSMLDEGTSQLTSVQFKEKLQNLATGIEYEVDKDDFSGQMLTVKENLAQAVDLLRQTLYEPRLDEKDLQRLKSQTLQVIKRRKESPAARLQDAVGKIVFGDHPYSVTSVGTENGVKAVKTDDIRRFMTDKLTKKNLFIGIAGDISEDEAAQMVDTIFGGLPDGKDGVEPVKPQIDFAAREEDIADDVPQVLTSVIAPGVARLDKNFYPLYIANYIFGGAGLNSRVNQAAREKEGLTYGAYSGLNLLKKSPLLVGGFSTTPGNHEAMQKIFVAEWKKMGSEGVSDKELRAAKNYLRNSYNLRFSSIEHLASILASIQREDLGINFLRKRNNYIENVTLEQVNRAAKQYFDPDKLIIINLGINR